MACNISLKDRFQPSAENGGVWIFNGYSIDDTTYSNYGQLTIGQPIGSGDNPTIDSELLDQGYYKFIYLIDTPGCDDSAETKLYVQDMCYPSSSPSQSLRSYNIEICYDVDADDPATVNVIDILQGAVQSGCTVDLSSATITQESGPTYTLPVDYIIDSSAMYASITSPVEGSAYSFVYNINFNSDNVETYFSCTSCSVLLGIQFRIKGTIDLLSSSYGTVTNPILPGDGIAGGGGPGSLYPDGLDWSQVVDNTTGFTYFGEGPDVSSPAPGLTTTIPGNLAGQNNPANDIVQVGDDNAPLDYLCALNSGDLLRYDPDNSSTCSALGIIPIRINTLPSGLYAFHICPSASSVSCNKCQTIYVQSSCATIFGDAEIVVNVNPTTQEVQSISYTGVNCNSPNTLIGTWTAPNGATADAVTNNTIQLVDGLGEPIYGAGAYTLELFCGACSTVLTYNYCPPELYTADFDAATATITLTQVGNSIVSNPTIIWTDPSDTVVDSGSNTSLVVENCGTYTINIFTDFGQPSQCSQTIFIDACGLTNDLTYIPEVLTANIGCAYSTPPSPYVCGSQTEDYFWTLYNLSGTTVLNTFGDQTLDLSTVGQATGIDGVYQSTYQCGSCAASDFYTVCPNPSDFDLILEQNGCSIDVTLDITTAGLTFSPNRYRIYIINETTEDTQLYDSGQITPANPLSGSITTTISTQSLSPQPASTDVITAQIQFTYLYPGNQSIPSACPITSSNSINVATNLCPNLQAGISYNSSTFTLTGTATGYHPSGNVQFTSWRFEDTGALFGSGLFITLNPSTIYYGWYTNLCTVTFDNCSPQPPCSDTAARLVCPPQADVEPILTFVEDTDGNYVQLELPGPVYANASITGNQIQYSAIIIESLADPSVQYITSRLLDTLPLNSPYIATVAEAQYGSTIAGPFRAYVSNLFITYNYSGGQNACNYGGFTTETTGSSSDLDRYANYDVCYKPPGDSAAAIRVTVPLSIFYDYSGNFETARYNTASISVTLVGGNNPGTYSATLQSLTQGGYFFDTTAGNGDSLRTFNITSPLLDVAFINTNSSSSFFQFTDVDGNPQTTSTQFLVQSC